MICVIVFIFLKCHLVKNVHFTIQMMTFFLGKQMIDWIAQMVG